MLPSSVFRCNVVVLLDSSFLSGLTPKEVEAAQCFPPEKGAMQKQSVDFFLPLPPHQHPPPPPQKKPFFSISVKAVNKPVFVADKKPRSLRRVKALGI